MTISRHRRDVKTFPPISNKNLQPRTPMLHKHIDRLRIRMLRSIHHRLTRSPHSSTTSSISHNILPHLHRIDTHPKQILNLSHSLINRQKHRLLLHRRIKQPGTQLTLLPTRQTRNLRGVITALLNQRQRLQHRIMQLRSNRSTLILRRTRRTLLPQPHPQRQTQRHHPSKRQRSSNHTAHKRRAVLPIRQNQQQPCKHQRHPSAHRHNKTALLKPPSSIQILIPRAPHQHSPHRNSPQRQQ